VEERKMDGSSDEKSIIHVCQDSVEKKTLLPGPSQIFPASFTPELASLYDSLVILL
jgi:hypothetical protein